MGASHRKVEDSNATARWRDGVHISTTSVWCDAYRARDICFVSSADAVKPSRHGQVIATAETLALLSRSERRSQPESELSVPPSRPFTLGTVRLELYQTGHAIGSAGLWLSSESGRVCYSGMVCPRGLGLAGPADTRAAEVLIIAAPYGRATYRFPDPEKAAADTIDFCTSVGESGVAVVLVSSAVKGLDVATHLAKAGLDVWGARQIHHAARRLARAGITLPPVRRFSKTSLKPGRTLVWPTALVDRLPPLPPGSRVALVSGEAVMPESVARVGAEVGFAWSNCADHDDLIEYIDATGAREVFLTGRHNEELARALDGRKRRVKPLGPPKQLSLL